MVTKLLSLLAAGAAVAALGACAADPATRTASADGMVCTREVPIGSSLPVTKCRTRQEVENERAAAERTRDDIRAVPSQPAPDRVGR